MAHKGQSIPRSPHTNQLEVRYVFNNPQLFEGDLDMAEANQMIRQLESDGGGTVGVR